MPIRRHFSEGAPRLRTGMLLRSNARRTVPGQTFKRAAISHIGLPWRTYSSATCSLVTFTGHGILSGPPQAVLVVARRVGPAPLAEKVHHHRCLLLAGAIAVVHDQVEVRPIETVRVEG